MRRFLLAIASLLMGLTALSSVIVLATGGGSAVGAALVSFLATLVVGLVLSAPFFLRPPDAGGGWSLTLPIALALVVLILRGVSWVGFMILYGAWYLLLLPRRLGSGKMPPAVASALLSSAPSVGTPLKRPRGDAPASWRPDPSGRFKQRYWDGIAWTSLVSDGTATAIDPP